MNGLQSRSMLAALALLAVASLVSAQITFSRDWSGGKRAAPDLALDCQQFARLCRHFIHEVKTAVSSQDAPGLKRRKPGLDDAPLLYDEEK